MPQRIRLPEQNHVTLVGRLTRDPDLRYTPKGDAVCSFGLAINRSFKNSSGEWQKETSFVPIVVWRDTAVRCNERLKKGFPVYVNGRLKSRSWEDKEGKRHSVIEVQAQRIQFLQLSDSEEGASAEKAEESAGSAAAGSAAETAGTTGDEEIPF
jgi:single-strand DNA-binding protein